MHGTELQELAAARADELPGAELTHPFGPGSDVWKVRGRMFMLQTDLADGPVVILKAAPADSAALRQAHADITPGYHMNKRHWITVAPGGTVDAELLRDLVTESYLLVIEGLPRAERPVDPATFGQRS
jgi:predicted DNA-binding protein (MmcQ/YjbR family)